MGRSLTSRHKDRLAPFQRVCFWCGKEFVENRQTVVAHWYPKALGGPDENWNLKLAHLDCRKTMERKCHIGDISVVRRGAEEAFLRWASRNEVTIERAAIILLRNKEQNAHKLRSNKDIERLRARHVFNKNRDKDDNICYWCDREVADEDFSIDHWYPLVLGGPSEPWNLKIMHKDCNNEKDTTVLPDAETAFEKWWQMRQEEIEAEKEVLRDIISNY